MKTMGGGGGSQRSQPEGRGGGCVANNAVEFWKVQIPRKFNVCFTFQEDGKTKKTSRNEK